MFIKLFTKRNKHKPIKPSPEKKQDTKQLPKNNNFETEKYFINAMHII
jgi:hypothetical protein